jgi:hypothetical protein
MALLDSYSFTNWNQRICIQFIFNANSFFNSFNPNELLFMKNYLLPIVVLTLTSFPLQAKQIAKEQLPAKIIAHFTKKHPIVTDFVAEEKTHFGQALIEINFKEEKKTKVLDEEAAEVKPVNIKEETAVFYRADGHFFVNAEKIYAFNVIPELITNALKKLYPDYKVTAAQLIPNPNGAGEEYEVTLNSRGHIWAVSVSGKGAVISQEDQGLVK